MTNRGVARVRAGASAVVMLEGSGAIAAGEADGRARKDLVAVRARASRGGCDARDTSTNVEREARPPGAIPIFKCAGTW